MPATAVPSDAMAERKASNPATIGLRLDSELVRRMREFANTHPMQPSMTHLINLSMREFLDAHEHELPAAPDPKRKPRT